MNKSIATPNSTYDIILISGEYHVDHPLSPTGVIKKVLEDKGFSVGIIEKPNWKTNTDFLKLGKPKLFFGVTSGSIDSMLVNYTPLKKLRSEDKNNSYDSKIPNRAVIVYCNKLKELFKDTCIVIGGIEASMRRFTHYDYWDNTIRKSILIDSRADILVYGSGEYQITEIAKNLKENKPINNIDGTCILSNQVPNNFDLLPSFNEVIENKEKFCKMQITFSNNKNLAQEFNKKFVLQYKMHKYTTKELDYIYNLNYSRIIPKNFPEFKLVQFTVVTHRGCIGDCNFCSITLHQGNRIISRSEKSILSEIEKLTKHKDFKGYIDDLGGPSANMYGMDCNLCETGKCLTCKNLNKSHLKLISLMKKAREITGIKKIFIHSGIRFDLAVESEEYIKEISLNHISGCLKIAPEHFSKQVLTLMNKDTNKFQDFKKIFDTYNKSLNQELKYYFMTAHPGSSMKEAKELKEHLKKLKNTESIQIFTPTPMTISTCMYYTGLNPHTLKPIYVPYTYNEKKKQKNILFEN